MTDIPAVVYIKTTRLDGPAIHSKPESNRDANMEPAMKKMKISRLRENDKDCESLKNFLINFNKEITGKLDSIERQVDILSENYDVLGKKVEDLSLIVSKQVETLVMNGDHMLNENGAVPVSSKVTFITLNREEDYPNGTWLGDPDNPERRVRCHITPTELFHIHTTCPTAEKMALTLLDYLFDRETQACSNISGMGKHKKKQLDPLYVYGLKCHLNFNFGITEQDWNKIKQNLDSKCRTAFRRKIKGLPLTPKGTHHGEKEARRDDLHFSDSISQNSIENGDQLSNESITFQIIKSENEAHLLERAIKEAKGDFQILHATAEEVAKIQQTHSLQLT
ncbi:protein BANP-like isoform X2 [Argiope bruennichi]|uniref:protein BANP-like isoform X2 n=1 Tax=Argiope bruennichi TaxID=94029 RepID=UPI0024943374|nr:protein BANP-like isoform X2 [Argiope bruennichi]